MGWIAVIKEMFANETPIVIAEIKKIKRVNIEERIDGFWKLLSSGQHIRNN